MAGLAGDVSGLGVPAEFGGTGDKQIQTMTIGATHVSAFVGINGPYWVDSPSGPNHNGLIDRDGSGAIIAAEVNSEAVGLVIDDLNFGLFVGMPTIQLDPIRYIALKATAQTVRLVGIPNVTANANSLSVELNISSPALGGLPILPVINFAGIGTDHKFAIKTGAKNMDGSDVTIDLTMNSPLIRAEGRFELNLLGIVTFTGSLAFELGPTKRVTLIDGTTQKDVTTMSIGGANLAAFVGINGPYWTDTNHNGIVDSGELSSSAVGLAITNAGFGILVMKAVTNDGIYLAGKLRVPAPGGGTPAGFQLVGVPQVEVNGSLEVELNLGIGTSGVQPVNFLLSFPDPDADGPKVAGYAVNTGPGGAPVILDFNDLRTKVKITGHLTIASAFVLDGAFLFDASSTSISIAIAATMSLSPLGAMTANGALKLDASGLVGRVELTVGAGLTGAGLKMTGYFLLEVNTSGGPKTLTLLDFKSGGGVEEKLVTIESGVLVRASATLEFAGLLSASGFLEIRASGSSFRLIGDLSLGALFITTTLHVDFFISAAGIQLNAAVTMSANLAEILKIEASGTLAINTTDSNYVVGSRTYGPHSAGLDLTGTISILEVLKFNATLTIQIGGGTDSFVLPASVSNPLRAEDRPTSYDRSLGTNEFAVAFSADINLFGIVTLGSQGWFNSKGNFGVHLGGDITIGSSSFGIVGGFDVWASRTGASHILRFAGGAEASVRLFGWSIAGASVHFDYDGGTGLITITGGIHLSFFFFDIDIERTFTVGYFMTPPPVFLAGSTSTAKLENGSAVDSDGILHLNMGARAGNRDLAEDNLNESYTIRHIDGTAGNETVEVVAFGRSQRFTGVKRIVADGGSGDDMITVQNGVLSSVDLSGGTGDDVIVVQSSGGTDNKIDGGLGNDYIEVGSSAPFQIWGGPDAAGGSDDDYISAGSGADTIKGGAGNDTIYGHGGNDTINGGLGVDRLFGGTGLDKVYGDEDSDNIIWELGDGDDLEVDGGTGIDTFTIVRGTGIDLGTITGGTNAVTVAWTGSNTLATTKFEALDINLGTGADSLTVNDLAGSGITSISIDLGRNPNGVDSAGNQLYTPGDGASDSVTLFGGSGADIFTVSSGKEAKTDADLINVSRQGAYTYSVKILGTVWSGDWAQGDYLTINSQGGNDQILGANVSTRLLGMTFTAGDGNDTLVGTPFADHLNSGTGSDTVTGGTGTDVFTDTSTTSSGDIDTLVETFDNDTSIFDNLLVHGTILGDTGGTFYKGRISTEQVTAPADPLFPTPYVDPLRDRGDVYQAGAEVEVLTRSDGVTPIFRVARLTGGTGNNTMVVGDFDNQIKVGTTFMPVTPWTGNLTLDNFGNGGRNSSNGDSYNEYYIVNLSDNAGTKVLIGNTGAGFGFSEIYIYGTDQADNVTLLGSKAGTDTIGTVIFGDQFSTNLVPKLTLNGSGVAVPLYYQVNGSGQKVQRTDTSGRLIYDLTNPSTPVPIYLETTTVTPFPVMVLADNPTRSEVNFRNLGRVTVNTLGGDDAITIIDTAAPTIIREGTGADLAIVGVVRQINDPTNITLEFPVGIPIVDVANLTNGNSHVVTIYGGTDNDQFEVNHNSAKLYLAGEAGDDTFVINTFLQLTDAKTQDIANLATLFGGPGSNKYTYLQNAPVYISGGTGIDTIVINGTPIGDLFIVTDKYIAGAGRVVYFTGIERIEINAAGGDDQIYILSSPADLEVKVSGGSGNDQIHLGGDPPPLVFDPPPFEFQPPAYQVQDAPVPAVLPFNLNLGQITLDLSDWTPWNLGDLQSGAARAIESFINLVITIYGTLYPNLRPKAGTDITAIANAAASSASFEGWFHWWIWGFEVRTTATLPTIQLEYDGKVLPPLRTVVPDKVTVDPPPFAFKANANFKLTDIKGRVTIDAGIGSESTGDEVFVHANGSTTSLTGDLTTTTIPNLQAEGFQVYRKAGQPDIYVSLDSAFVGPTQVRTFSDGDAGTFTKTINSATNATSMGYTPKTEAGLVDKIVDGKRVIDASGNPVQIPGQVPVYETFYTQVAGGDGANTRTYYSLNGLGLGTGTALNGTHFSGVEFGNVENMTILLGDQADTFNISKGAPLALTLSTAGGGDTVNIKDINGTVRVMAGAGSDTINVTNDASKLDAIRANLTIEGNTYLLETPSHVLYDPNSSLQAAVLGSSLRVYVNTNAHASGASYTIYSFVDAAGNETFYTRQNLQPLVFRGGPSNSELWIRAVDLDPATGQLQEDLVQELNSSGVPMWRDTFGKLVAWDPNASNAWTSFPTQLLDYSHQYLASLQSLIQSLQNAFGFANLSTFTAAVRAEIIHHLAPSLIPVNRVLAAGTPLTASTMTEETSTAAATDILNFVDTNGTTAVTATLSNTQVTNLRPGITSFYSGIEQLNVFLGTLADTLTVTSTHAGQTNASGGGSGDTFNVQSTTGTLVVNGNAGADTVNVRSTAPTTLNQIAGALTVNGGGDLGDVLNLDDTGDTLANSNGNLTFNQVTGFSPASITYTGLATLNLYLGSAGDTLNIQSTHTNLTHIEGRNGGDVFIVRAISGLTEINGQNGADIFTVGNDVAGVSTVNGIQAMLVVNGGSEAGTADTLNVSELNEAASASAPGTLTSVLVSGLGMAATGGVTYAEFETLNVTLGKGDDTFAIASTHAAITNLFAGEGADHINIAMVNGVTSIWGQAGDDDIRVNVDASGNERPGINGVGADLNLDGQEGADTYRLFLAGSMFSAGHPISIVNVNNSGAPGTGADLLEISGTDNPNLTDNFLIRANFIALLPAGGASAERINYNNTINAGVAIYGRGGDDYFVFDDNSTTMTVDGGEGNDTFQIGQMFDSARVPPNVAGSDVVATVATTRGYLSSGVHFDTTIYGGNGNDQFIIFNNQGPLSLFGEDGNDSFVVRAFALAGSQPVDPNRQGTSINAGLGADYVEYNVNAPVAIDGGDGLDKIVVVGTEFSDHIVVTSTGIYGAGLFVTYTGVEVIELDGAEGNDHFSILSTPVGVVTRLFGGLGSDTFDVGGQGGTVVSRDLEGHSGIIDNLFVSGDVAYSDIGIEGVAVDVADNDAPGVVITQSGGSTIVAEVDYGIGLTIDSYTIVLTAPPTGGKDVFITASAPVSSQSAIQAGSKSVLLSTNSSGASATRAVELKFTSANWSTPQTVYVVAQNDTAAEGTRLAVIQHSISNVSAAGYAGLALPNVPVTIIDNDTSGIVLIPVAGTTVGSERIGTINPILEGTFAISSQYFALIATQGNTTVNLTGSQVSIVSGATYNFATNGPAQLVQVRAIADGVVEGRHRGLVTATATGITTTQLEVPIADGDYAGVLILPTNGSTRVAEGGTGATASDTYGVALTKAPAPGTTVTIGITPDAQVAVSATTLTFTTSNWFVPQIVTVTAVNDTVVDAADIQSFAHTLQNLDAIRGPLYIEGGPNPTAGLTLPDPLLYIGEADPTAPASPTNPNLLVVEADQIDSLWVYNNDAVATQSGVLTSTRLSGLGMGGDLTIDGQLFAGGITYANLEMFSVYLGKGADTFEVQSTHSGETLVDAGSGNDVVNVRTVQGHTTVLGSNGNDQVNLGFAGATGQTVDRLRALVTVDGGAGTDTITVDDRGDTNANVGTLDTTTLTGLDMLEAKVRTVTIPDAQVGTFTLSVDGAAHTTGLLELMATAADVRTALLALNLPGVSDIVVNRADNVFTLNFLGDESLGASALTVTATSTPASTAVGNLLNRVQTITLPAASGTFTVTIANNPLTFNITVGASADTVRDAIITAFNPTHGPGIGVKDVFVTRYGSTYEVVFQGLLSGDRGATHLFSVAPRSTTNPTGFAINAIGGTFRLNVNVGATMVQTSPVSWNASAAEVQGVLRAILGSSTLTVSLAGSTYTVVGATVASVEDVNLVAPVAVALRTTGLNYFGTETFNLLLGSGADVLNVRGTSAVTNIATNAGDDRVYVSSLANENLVSAATTDFLRGNLDRITGTLNLDLGDGRHLLMISDEAAIAGDGTAATPVRITDQAVPGLPATNINITGLTPAPAITYMTSAAGNLADGITLWTGWGADTIVVDGTHQRGNGANGSLRTVTTLNTGLGNDNVTVNLNSADGFLVLNTQGPENAYAGLLADRDTVDASASSRQMLIFGGQDDDNIKGGTAGDVIFGDRGLVTYYNGTTAVAVFGHGGPGDFTDGVERPLGFVTTTFPGVGGNDTVFGLQGRDIVFGGFGNDILNAAADDVADDILVGDNGKASFTLGVITLVDTTDTDLGGNDTLTAGKGANVAFGGMGDDTIFAGGDALSDILVGDNGTAMFNPANGKLLDITTTAPGHAGRDELRTGDGDNVVFGGSYSDLIVTGPGNDTIVGDNGHAIFDVVTFKLTSITTLAPDQATGLGRVVNGVTYDDVIDAAGGNNVVFGGSHADNITTQGGIDDIVGDNGSATFDPTGVLRTIVTGDVAYGGNDMIKSGTGADVVLGGSGGDDIDSGSVAAGDVSRDVVVGDNGRAEFDAAGNLSYITTADPSVGGNDTIAIGGGHNVAFGGVGDDTITAGDGNDIVVGDNGAATFHATTHTLVNIHTSDVTFGGVDTILAGNGNNVVLGGSANDTITTGSDDDIALGDNGYVDYVVTDGNPADIDLIASTDYATGGIDTITTNGGADIVIGGADSDNVDAGQGNNLVFGDNARITAAIVDAPNFSTQPLTIGRLETIAPTIGGSDTLKTGTGRDIILGGTGGDTITANIGETALVPDGDNIVIGDDGYIDFTRAEREPTALGGDTSPADMDVIASTDFTDGGVDTIITGNGSDIVIGGQAGDTITANNGRNLLIGDNGLITAATEDLHRFSSQPITVGRVETIEFGVGGADTITSGSGHDVILGGTAGDSLAAGDGDNVVLGDDGVIEYVRLERSTATEGADKNALDIDLILSVSTTDFGGADTITSGAGNDIVIGGRYGDTIDAGNGNNIALGDNAKITAANEDSPRFGNQEMTVGRVETIELSDGGADTIRSGSGQDILIGGVVGDRIDGGAGDDLIVGDNATVDRTGRVGNFKNGLFEALGGTLIYDINGNVLVNGVAANQPGGAPVWGDMTLVLLNHSLTEQNTVGSTRFGNDYIAGGAGNDRIFGGLGDDIIQGDGSIDLVVSATRLADGTLLVSGSVENATDGDDYIEGNGGKDTIFGGLGQDDIIGGSSNLFGLTTPEMRPDGADMIFGGAATDTAREFDGDLIATGRARDADTIIGDNGNIYRLVGTNGVAGSSYLTFAYDNYGTLKIVPRAVQLLDYTPGGIDLSPAAVNDIGAADEIHGESGNDTIYGGLGNDVLFGDAQDDDIIGGTGADWISAGNGDDGVLGDDGRIYTSRNGTAEPLYGLGAIPDGGLNLLITTPGGHQSSTINVSGALKKTAVLDPFMLQGIETVPGVTPSNDIIFGGLGNDFLHGGAGDDAISGAEALPGYYAVPFNPGNILGWGLARAGEFAGYDEYNPLTKVYVNPVTFEFTSSSTPGRIEFILNFVSTEQDGNDVIFGDVGNDWIVGGMGRDHLYGGYGDDLLNGDDNQDTAGGLNNVPDGPDTNQEDIAYGGAGRDVLIANTMGDRLIDWAGEFNSYIVPFAPFGAPTISRALQPQLMEYLYDLSASDGADPTRATKTGSAIDRNGEPEGELGLVKQSDFDWGDQTGAPADPQPGNIPGGSRDVVQAANFNTGTADGFAPDSGTWTVTGGRYQVSPAANSLITDAVSVYLVDSQIPRYFEIQATINAVKPIGGLKANAYIIFDYQSSTDFKFAGINISTNKLEIGHRTASGWVVDSSSNMQLKGGQDYNVLVAINGVVVTIVVDNSTTNVLSYAFQPRVIDGYRYDLNTGMVGIGANNAAAQIDNVRVQILPPAITFQDTETLADGRANLLTGAQVGQWTVAAGRDTGTPGSGGFAVSNFDLGLSTSSLLLIDTTVKITSTGTSGGVVFDYYDANNFKFAAVIAGTNQVVIGHYTKGGWTIDATATRTIATNTDYTLSLSLKGTTVSVSVNGQAAVGFAFNAAVTDGQAGLLTRGGSSSFAGYTVKTDDGKFITTPHPVPPAPTISATGDESVASTSIVSPSVSTTAAVSLNRDVAIVKSSRVSTREVGLFGFGRGDTGDDQPGLVGARL